MKTYLLSFLILIGFACYAQPVLLNNNYAAIAVSEVTHDTLNNKLYYNYCTAVCGNWGTGATTCKLINTTNSVFGVLSPHENYLNKYNFNDNNLVTQLQNSQISSTPIQGVSSYSAAYAQKSVKTGSQFYTNLGFMFKRIDTTSFTTVWSYSLTTGAKEISTFEHRNDSLFLFEKDSTSLTNYYSLIVKSKLSGSTISYNSLLASNPSNSKGAIKGKIKNSYLIGNTIILSGIFTASVSGIQVCNNLAVINISTGQLSAAPINFNSGSKINDMEFANNKFYLAGNFTSVNSNTRYNLAVLDQNLNLLPDTINIRGTSTPTNVYVDDITFYDNVLLAKGNFNSINSFSLSATDTYSPRAFNTNLNSVLPYTINTPTIATAAENKWLFKAVKNKLYINRFKGSGFFIYCLPPSQTALNIIHSNSLNNINTQSVCVPNSTLSPVTFTAPFRNASIYNWSYTGSGVTLLPVGNGSVVSFIGNLSATSGSLIVSATNDCGASSPTVALQINIKLNPTFNTTSNALSLICNPDSLQLLATTTNTNATLFWRKQSSNAYSIQPVYIKTPGNYFIVAKDGVNGCNDSSVVLVNTNYNTPNSKLISHTYSGPAIAVDSVTCYQPTVTVIGGSDTSGVTYTWRNLITNSLTPNPINLMSQANVKLIVTKTSNGCADSSLFVFVAQYNAPINFSLSANAYSINCSYYTATLQALSSSTDNITVWSGNSFTNTPNPTITNSIGNYTVVSTNTLSGCAKTETVNVLLSNSLILNSSNDTLVCKNSNITLSTSPVGTLSAVSYSWSNGPVTTNNNITVATTSSYVVTASGANNCLGSDTVIVTIAPSIQDSIVAYKSCDNTTSGSLVLFVNAGIAPFQYSINNGLSFSTNNTFTNQAFATYTTIIKDALGCTKSNTIALNAFSNLPTPKFIASTKNTMADTIVLVDISIPKADSVQWILPTSVIKIGGTMFNPIIVASDTGNFSVTMRAFYGNCIINTNKLIRFGVIDTLQATNFNANGIKSVILFPNPNNGQFSVNVEFYKKQNSSIQVWNSIGNQFMQQNFYDSLVINLPVNLTQLQNGTYIFRVIGEYDAENVTFIISK